MTIALRLFHILGGIFWVGVILFNAFFLGPAVRAVGPDGGKVMKALVDRKLTAVIPTVAIITVLTGLWLYDRASLHFQPAYLRSGPGATFGIGGLLAIITLIVGGAILAPAIDNSIKYGQLAGAASGAEKEALMAKAQAARVTVGKASQFVALTGTLAAACMAAARYM